MKSFKQYLWEMQNQNDIPPEHAMKSPLPYAEYPYHKFTPKKASESDMHRYNGPEFEGVIDYIKNL